MNGAFNANSLHSESDLLLRNGATFKSYVSLHGAKIDGDVDMTGATSFNDVELGSAKITGQINMTGASFHGELGADKLQVGTSLIMRSTTRTRPASRTWFCAARKFSGQISMIGASFDGRSTPKACVSIVLFFMRDANFADAVEMIFAHIGTNLDLRGATLVGLDLSHASIEGDLQLDGLRPPWKGKNGKPGDLNLQNAHIGSLSDARIGGTLLDAQDAWPAQDQLHLDGSASIISADLKEKPNRKCARGA